MRLKRAHKYSAVRTMVDDIWFPSKAEARRFAELRLLERAGEIRNLTLQPEFKMVVNGKDCGNYRADFAYFTDKERVVEDVKGMKTPVYRLKKKIVEAIYGVRITEICA